ncbi:hypothetical protein Tco_1124597 [Tanacetum coccineum]|uniref:Replication protein A 70 kDa DNA-binding subunit B/D first OB fold domain-containing protein n=1 Tax=Tanacetum coccineum TaxID=301880 RepID=A0ABQ5J6L0_9ASTR
MSNRYRYISELYANVTDNWTVNVMVSRVWTTYNLKNNQVITLDIIIVDERVSDMRQVDVKGVMDGEDTKEAYVKKDDMKESQI